MSNWPMVPLTEVLELQRRWVEIDPFTTYEEIGVRCFGKGIFHKTAVDGVTLGNKRVLSIKPNDLVFNNVFAWEGAVAVAGPDENGKIGSHRFVTYTVNPKKATPRFLQLYFTTEGGLEVLKKASPGSAGRNKTLGLERFISQSIPLPPLSEQLKIVEWIDAVATRVEEAKDLREQASNASESLWKGLKRKLLDQAGTAGTRELGDIVRITGGGTPSKQNPLFWDGDIPWISPKDMKSVNIDGAIDSITEAGVQNSSAKILPKDAVLIVIRGMILAHTVPVGLLKVPATINQDMKALIPNDGILPSYLCHALWSLNEELLKLVDRSTHDTRKLTTPKLLSFRIPVPDIDVQTSFVNESEEVNSTIQTAESLTHSSQRELEALLPSALNQIFDGGGHG